MPYQYTAPAWAARLAALNAANGTNVVMPVAVANAVIAAAENDQELARAAISTFNNIVDLRRRMYVLNPADAGIAVATTILTQIQARWPDDIPSVPVVSQEPA